MRLSDYAPTTMGPLAEHPATLEALQERIQSLSLEELVAMQRVFSRVPKWQMVPELLATTLPDELRAGIDEVRKFASQEIQELEDFRLEISRIYVILTLLPDEKLKELGQSRNKVRASQLVYRKMNLTQLSAARSRLEQNPTWKDISATLLGSLSPEVEKAINQLVSKGEFTAHDFRELEQFRTEMIGFFASLLLLPANQLGDFDLSVADQAIVTFRGLQPEMLFLVRARIESHPRWNKLPQSLHKNFSEEDLVQL